MKRAVIYARVSTERQADEGLSVDSQIDACRRKAAELGAAVLHVYRDDGISGSTDARPGFRAAISHCTVSGADFLLCWSSSRFARNQLDALVYKRELAASGVRLVYANSGLDLQTNEGWLADSFSQIIDEAYSRQVSADTRRSMLSAARDGYFMGGRVPYGYEAVQAPGTKRRRLVVQPDEAAVVAQMFRQSARHIGGFAIAAGLNGQGITLRGRPWSKNTVLCILKSEVYMGQVIFNRFNRKHRRENPVDDWVRVQAHEPIVTSDLFAEVQAGLSSREPAPGAAPANTQHLFSGLMKCGLCGASMKMSTGKGRNGTTYFYYACNGALQGRGCAFKPLPAGKFDTWAMSELLDRVLTRENVQAVLDQMDAAATNWVKDRAARRRSLVAELREAEGRRSKLYEVLEVAGKHAPGVEDLGPRLRELNEQVKRLELALVAVEDEHEPLMPQLAVSAADAEKVLRDLVAQCESPRALRDFVASIVARIEVGLKEVRVDYHPDCLVRNGAMVHSASSWLPVVGTLRTARIVLRLPELKRAA